MVEVATALGCTLHISPVVMGLTVLAIGTSFPDFISSIYSAQAGKGKNILSFLINVAFVLQHLILSIHFG